MIFKKLFSKANLAIVIENVGDNTMFTCLLLFGGLWILCKVVSLVLDFRFKCKQLESKERLKKKKMELATKPQQSKQKKRKKGKKR